MLDGRLLSGRLDHCLLGDWLFQWSEVVSEKVVRRTSLHRLVYRDHVVEQVSLLSTSLREFVNSRDIWRRRGWR